MADLTDTERDVIAMCLAEAADAGARARHEAESGPMLRSFIRAQTLRDVARSV